MPAKKSPSASPRGKRLAEIRRRILSIAEAPGVYRWLGEGGGVLYVGKAKNLKHRLLSYVQPGQKHSAWKDIMMRNVRDVDVTLTNSELEAFILETNLIKQHRPKYNIMMKDDKNYVYVRIPIKDDYPRIDVVRRMEDDGALYFGPKTSAEEVRSSLTLLRKLFPFRTCKMEIEAKHKNEMDEKNKRNEMISGKTKVKLEVVCRNRDRATPCLDYHIRQCTAPCVGYVTPEEYRRDALNGVIAFFEGKHGGIVALLKERMRDAAENKKFERAAELRDQLTRIASLQEKQIISDTSRENADVFGVALLSGRAHIVLLKERDGRLVGEESFALQGSADSVGDALDEFLPQYYASTTDFPDTVVLSDEPSSLEGLRAWLALERGKKIPVVVPQRGKKSTLLLLAEKNAHWKARQGEAKWEARGRTIEDALNGLQIALDLPAAPQRIEGYDISHLGGSFTVGSMVVMIGGKPRNDQYRSFSIRTLSDRQVDDYAALKEVLRRRLRHIVLDLKTDERRWSEDGVIIGKARKADSDAIRAFVSTSEGAKPDLTEFLVARRDEHIVGCARLIMHSDKIAELQPLFIDPAYRDRKLLPLLERKILQRVKKGKVYIMISADRHERYADLGFRHVLEEPKVLKERIDALHAADLTQERRMVMMFEAIKNKRDVSLTAVPDLLVIDGGRGQLSAALEALKESGLTIPIMSLAKREEEIFVPEKFEPIEMAKDAPAQFLLQRLRDEAHRFANELRKKQGASAMFRSALDDVPGIGPKTRQILLKRFGSVDLIRAASDEELASLLTQPQLAALRERLMTAE